MSKPQTGVVNFPRVLEDKPSRTEKAFTERKALQDGSWLVSSETPCLPSLEVEHLIVDWFSFS